MARPEPTDHVGLEHLERMAELPNNYPQQFKIATTIMDMERK
jgi:hypothetical protein